MQKFDEMELALGDPIIKRPVGDPAMGAVVARWRHGHVSIPLSANGAAHVVLGLSGGEAARRRGRAELNKTVVGRVGLMPHEEPTVTEIGPAEAFHIFLPPSLLEMAGDRAAPHIDHSFEATNPDLRRNVLEVFVATHQKDPDAELRLDTSVLGLAQTLLVGTRPSPPSRSAGGLAPAVKRRIDDLINSRINSDYSVPLKLADMADAAQLSVDHFTRMFRKETGTTPYLYVSRRRLERAMDLLTKPTMSIGDAADQTGFCSPSHFVAAFRRHLGVTPASFRDAVCNIGIR